MSEVSDFDIACQRLSWLASNPRTPQAGPWKSYAELEGERGQLLAQVAAMRAALLDVQDLMQRKCRWDNEDLEYGRRISCALDGTAANAITAEWDQLRERVAELERMVAVLERGAERANST